ncbi:DUF3828 domain-containing protein [Paraburkholderia sp. MMS20-SJTR3]|uniref:DUF3828 domain-containing protein n=1 Tax=Paraburkholderia sejongensis TaxID=2886946 RepID=A0ABS8K4H2_9BURK|nr:DUF3828 domain-containing protein [Paraburkholderia sp. MMS20-SJTR3]MCC8396993.1 DUF3828 domain-containing protein [Paraburkholderia sp. MMS20-SJTR3]
MDKEIMRYVNPATVEQLRELYLNDALPGDANYFTKAQDVDERNWLAHTIVHPALMLADGALVAVTFGTGGMRTSAVVILRKIDSNWRITKVIDPRGGP